MNMNANTAKLRHCGPNVLFLMDGNLERDGGSSIGFCSSSDSGLRLNTKPLSRGDAEGTS